MAKSQRDQGEKNCGRDGRAMPKSCGTYCATKTTGFRRGIPDASTHQALDQTVVYWFVARDVVLNDIVLLLMFKYAVTGPIALFVADYTKWIPAKFGHRFLQLDETVTNSGAIEHAGKHSPLQFLRHSRKIGRKGILTHYRRSKLAQGL